MPVERRPGRCRTLATTSVLALSLAATGAAAETATPASRADAARAAAAPQTAQAETAQAETAPDAVAAEEEADADANDGEIVVRAQRRPQAISRVPISITAFTEEDIEAQRIQGVADFAVRTPNLAFTNGGTRSEVRFSIRGIGPISSGGSANSVGLYLDEFNILPNVLTRTADLELTDASQIEILRGPQGTFFGRNSVGGAINITSVKPQFDELSGDATAEYGSFESYRLQGRVNVPITSNFALRAIGYYDESDGYLDQVGTHDEADATENYGGRLSARWQPTQDLTIDVAGSYSNQKQELPTFVPGTFISSSIDLLRQLVPVAQAFGQGPPAGITVPFRPNGVFPGNDERISTDIGQPLENETTILTARLDYDIPDLFTTTLIAGYIDNEFRQDGEGDYTALPVHTVRRDTDLESYSFELRFSDSTDLMSWTVGGIYAYDESETYQNSIHLANDPLRGTYDAAFAFLGGNLFGLVPGAPRTPQPGFQPCRPAFLGGTCTSVGFFENVSFGGETDSYAVFGDVTFNLTDAWTVSAGARYSYEELQGFRREGPLVTPLAPRVGFNNVTVNYDDFSPRFATTYEIYDDIILYGTISRGFRSGSFNAVGEPFVRPETALNYEFGSKGRLLDGRLNYSLSVFFIDREDVQIRAQDVITQRQLLINASGVETQGGELSVGLEPIENLTLQFDYGYLNAEFEDFRNARDLDGNALNATGFRVPRSPEHSVSASAQYDWMIVEGYDLSLRAEYTYVDEFKEDVSLNNRRLNPEYSLVNLRAALDTERFRVFAFAENLFDESYRYGVSNLETYVSGSQVSVGEPQRFGIGVTVRLGGAAAE